MHQLVMIYRFQQKWDISTTLVFEFFKEIGY
jgi:hypothetical protein